MVCPTLDAFTCVHPWGLSDFTAEAYSPLNLFRLGTGNSCSFTACEDAQVAQTRLLLIRLSILYFSTAQEFYVNVLGFEDESSLRPDDKLPFDGAFVRAGATQVFTGNPHKHGNDVQHSGKRLTPYSFHWLRALVYSRSRNNSTGPDTAR